MDNIQHRGIVAAVKGSLVTVNITSYSACHNCDARHGCGLMDCQKKIVEIDTPEAFSYHVGEEVNVSLTPQAGLWAVFLSYGLPLILMLVTLIGASAAGMSELISGISGIIVLIPYYFWLFLNRKRFKRQFSFKISKA